MKTTEKLLCFLLFHWFLFKIIDSYCILFVCHSRSYSLIRNNSKYNKTNQLECFTRLIKQLFLLVIYIIKFRNKTRHYIYYTLFFSFKYNKSKKYKFNLFLVTFILNPLCYYQYQFF